MSHLDITLMHSHIVSPVPWYSANVHETHGLNDICRTTDGKSFVTCMENPNHNLTRPDLTYGASWNAWHFGRTRQTCIGGSPGTRAKCTEIWTIMSHFHWLGTRHVDHSLISSIVRMIIPIHFLHTGGKDCTYVANLKH